jgi:hypothetical protein
VNDLPDSAGEVEIRMPVGDKREETDDSCCILRPLYQYGTKGKGIGKVSYLCLNNYDGFFYNIASLCQTKSGNTIFFPGMTKRRIREMWFGHRLGGDAFTGMAIDHLTMNRDHARWHLTSRTNRHTNNYRVHSLSDFTSYWFGMSASSIDIFERTCRTYKIRGTGIDKLQDRLAEVLRDLDESPRVIFRLPEPTRRNLDHYLHFDVLIHHGSPEQLVPGIMYPATKPVTQPRSTILTVPLLTGGTLVIVGYWVEGNIPYEARLHWL